MWKKAAASCLIAGVLAFSAPMAANAETDDDSVGYVSPATVTVNPVAVAPCLSSTVTFGERFWGAGEPVSTSVAGYNADDASILSSATAAADGSLVAKFTPPADGRQDYAITFTGVGRQYVAVIAVANGVDADRTCDHDPGEPAAAGAALARTGGTVAPWIPIAGAGLLAAGGAVLVARTQRKRS